MSRHLIQAKFSRAQPLTVSISGGHSWRVALMSTAWHVPVASAADAHSTRACASVSRSHNMKVRA